MSRLLTSLTLCLMFCGCAAVPEPDARAPMPGKGAYSSSEGILFITADGDFLLETDLQRFGGTCTPIRENEVVGTVSTWHHSKTTLVDGKRNVEWVESPTPKGPSSYAKRTFFVLEPQKMSYEQYKTIDELEARSSKSQLRVPAPTDCFVFGGVKKPGKYPCKADTTVADMIKAAGGAISTEKKNNVHVRRGSNPNVITMKFDLDADPKANNTVVYPGDLISVP